MAHHNASAARMHHGFTLIEVMIVVAIIGILAAIAYPSYTEHVKRGRRAVAQTALLETAQAMQRFYAANNRYDKDLKGIPLAAPPSVSTANLAYTIEFKEDSPMANSFTLTATPTGVMNGDRCGTFTLDQTGTRDIENKPAGSTATPADCWK